MKGGVPQYTLAHYERDFADRHLLHGVLGRWAAISPDSTAMVVVDTGREYGYAELDRASTGLALELLELGFQKGDFLATSLPLLAEHVILEFACFKIGVIHAPLDLRLKASEVIRSLELIQARGFVLLGRTETVDFEPLARAVRESCSFVEHLLQIAPPPCTIDGAISALELFDRAMHATVDRSLHRRRFEELSASITEDDGAQVIYTTGSTGYPKPALLSHRNITCQCMCLAGAFGMDEELRMLVHLPPSHVGCQTEQLMTTLFGGGTAVVMHSFDAERTLQAIEDHRVNVLGQIPAMFAMQWQLPAFSRYDLSSLRLVLCAGQQVSRAFAERLAAQCPRLATGLGLTEMAGFVTYTATDLTPADLASQVGWDMPITPLTIRAPMRDDGRAGAEVPDGEVGEICFAGPQVFIAYVNDEAAYRRTVSTDGVCYTGDLGCVSARGLVFKGRSKLVIKPKGYQVHPAQIEDHFAQLSDQVAVCGAVGAPHDVFSEGIVLFVETKAGAKLDREHLQRHAREIASYQRPSHYVLLPPGGLPLNRTAKTDYVSLKEAALAEIEALRAAGGWDRAS